MPALRPLDFHWTWELRASPSALWPLVSDTDRFNRDCGYPPVEVIPPPDRVASSPYSRYLRAHVAGLKIEWAEEAFEWVEPTRFAVARHYLCGPVACLTVHCALQPRADGGTSLHYGMQVTPANLLGRVLLPYAIGRHARAETERVFRRYDEVARAGQRSSSIAQTVHLAAGGLARLDAIHRKLAAQDHRCAGIAEQLALFVRNADDHSAARMRPYALAARWGADRRATLELFLQATRAGLLDFSWDLICPHCRGVKVSERSLGLLRAEAHCDTCAADFTANFDQSVELTFSPNPAIRAVPRVDYCVGGPQVTPHVVAQLHLSAGRSHELTLALPPGRYRVRSPGLALQHALRITAPPDAAADAARIELCRHSPLEPSLAPGAQLQLVNASDTARLAILERLAWSDEATTAADVTCLQAFRDLFSHEVLRRGEKIQVGSITIVFTDLKNSTQLYREIGDAPAFGRVLTHFELLAQAIKAEGGSIVKTMGDAVMAVFTRPLAALRALTQAQAWLAHPEHLAADASLRFATTPAPLALKAAFHTGPCLVINQNDRLDYFGSTVNLAARLCALSTGRDLILTPAVRTDAEVESWLAAPGTPLVAIAETTTVRGFGNQTLEIWRASPKPPGPVRAEGGPASVPPA